MAISYCVLASGSGGNSAWLRGGGIEILVDCGLSARQIEHRLAAVGQSADHIHAIVCTHWHHDHVAGAAVLSRRHGIDLYATASTLRRIPGALSAERLHRLPSSGRVEIGGLKVSTTPTPHDAAGSVALCIADADTRVGVATDLGTPTPEIRRALAGVDGLILECNHDLDMLRDGPYPAMLKQRIRSRVGHLSNEQGARLAAELVHAGLQHLTLAHLSETNNTPGKAAGHVSSVLSRMGASWLELSVAGQHHPSEPVVLAPRAGGAALTPASTAAAQLWLPHMND